MSPSAAVVNRPPLVTSTVVPVSSSAFRVSALPVKSKAPLKVIVSVLSLPTVVVPVPAAWVKLAASTVDWKSTSAALLIRIASSASVLPTAPTKSMLPPSAVRVRSRGVTVSLSTVLLKVMSPIPAPVLMATSPSSWIASAKLMLSAVVVISPANSLVPPPLWVTAPSAVISPSAAVIKVPLLVTVTVVPVSSSAFSVRLVPVKAKAPLSVIVSVLSLPTVVVPVPASWVRLTASTVDRKSTSAALLTRIAPSGTATVPTVDWKSMLPVPAVSVRLSLLAVVPATASAKVMSPISAPPVLMATGPSRVTAVSKLMLSPVVVMSPDRVFDPAPSWVTASSAVISPAASVVNSPALVISTVEPVSSSAFRVSALPVKSNTSDRVIAPAIVVVPVPADWVTLTALTVDWKSTFAALVTSISPSGKANVPTAAWKSTLPAPATSSRFSVSAVEPVTAPTKVMVPSPALESTTTLDVSLVASLKVTPSVVVVISAPRSMPAPPLRSTAPSASIVPSISSVPATASRVTVLEESMLDTTRLEMVSVMLTAPTVELLPMV